MPQLPSQPMRDCAELAAMLSEYLDAELPEADCQALRAHIASCEECVQFVASLEKNIELCRASGAVPPGPVAIPEEVRGRLLAAYRASLAARQADEG